MQWQKKYYMVRKEVKQREKSQEVNCPYTPIPFYEMKFLQGEKKKVAELLMEKDKQIYLTLK